MLVSRRLGAFSITFFLYRRVGHLDLHSFPTRRSSDLVDMKQALAAGTMTIRPIKTLMNHATTEIFFDGVDVPADARSEEHTSELQSLTNLVCRLLLEKKNNIRHHHYPSVVTADAQHAT